MLFRLFYLCYSFWDYCLSLRRLKLNTALALYFQVSKINLWDIAMNLCNKIQPGQISTFGIIFENLGRLPTEKPASITLLSCIHLIKTTGIVICWKAASIFIGHLLSECENDLRRMIQIGIQFFAKSCQNAGVYWCEIFVCPIVCYST